MTCAIMGSNACRGPKLKSKCSIVGGSAFDRLGLTSPFQGANCDEYGKDPKQWDEFAEHRHHDFLATITAPAQPPKLEHYASVTSYP